MRLSHKEDASGLFAVITEDLDMPFIYDAHETVFRLDKRKQTGDILERPRIEQPIEDLKTRQAEGEEERGRRTHKKGGGGGRVEVRAMGGPARRRERRGGGGEEAKDAPLDPHASYRTGRDRASPGLPVLYSKEALRCFFLVMWAACFGLL